MNVEPFLSKSPITVYCWLTIDLDATLNEPSVHDILTQANRWIICIDGIAPVRLMFEPLERAQQADTPVWTGGRIEQATAWPAAGLEFREDCDIAFAAKELADGKVQVRLGFEAWQASSNQLWQLNLEASEVVMRTTREPSTYRLKLQSRPGGSVPSIQAVPIMSQLVDSSESEVDSTCEESPQPPPKPPSLAPRVSHSSPEDIDTPVAQLSSSEQQPQLQARPQPAQASAGAQAAPPAYSSQSSASSSDFQDSQTVHAALPALPSAAASVSRAAKPHPQLAVPPPAGAAPAKASLASAKAPSSAAAVLPAAASPVPSSTTDNASASAQAVPSPATPAVATAPATRQPRPPIPTAAAVVAAGASVQAASAPRNSVAVHIDPRVLGAAPASQLGHTSDSSDSFSTYDSFTGPRGPPSGWEPRRAEVSETPPQLGSLQSSAESPLRRKPRRQGLLVAARYSVSGSSASSLRSATSDSDSSLPATQPLVGGKRPRQPSTEAAVAPPQRASQVPPTRVPTSKAVGVHRANPAQATASRKLNRSGVSTPSPPPAPATSRVADAGAGAGHAKHSSPEPGLVARSSEMDLALTPVTDRRLGFLDQLHRGLLRWGSVEHVVRVIPVLSQHGTSVSAMQAVLGSAARECVSRCLVVTSAWCAAHGTRLQDVENTLRVLWPHMDLHSVLRGELDWEYHAGAAPERWIAALHSGKYWGKLNALAATGYETGSLARAMSSSRTTSVARAVRSALTTGRLRAHDPAMQRAARPHRVPGTGFTASDECDDGAGAAAQDSSSTDARLLPGLRAELQQSWTPEQVQDSLLRNSTLGLDSAARHRLAAQIACDAGLVEDLQPSLQDGVLGVSECSSGDEEEVNAHSGCTGVRHGEVDDTPRPGFAPARRRGASNQLGAALRKKSENSLAGRDTFASPFSPSAVLSAVGAVASAALAVLGGVKHAAFCLVRPPGHHAGCPHELGRQQGFCLANNVAVVAAQLMRTQPGLRLAIVDIDAHFGDGTYSLLRTFTHTGTPGDSPDAATAMERQPHGRSWRASGGAGAAAAAAAAAAGTGGKPRFVFATIHAHKDDVFPASKFGSKFPGNGQTQPAYSIDGPVAHGTFVVRGMPIGSTAEAWRAELHSHVLPAVRELKPDIIFISAGFDAHQHDPLGLLKLTEDDYSHVVLELSKCMLVPRIVSVLEGGYGVHARNGFALQQSIIRHVQALGAVAKSAIAASSSSALQAQATLQSLVPRPR